MKKREYDIPDYRGNYTEVGTSVLRNKLDITDEYEIQVQETIGFTKAYRHFANELTKDTVFNNVYICSIHKMALEHLYYFAGMYRKVDLSKAGHNFFPVSHIHTAMTYYEKEYLTNLPADYKSKEELILDLAKTHIELIHIHPFREGNGRTSRIYANLISLRAGFGEIKLENFSRKYYDRYINALNEGDNLNYEPMISIIGELL